jgi:hypothetical protein
MQQVGVDSNHLRAQPYCPRYLEELTSSAWGRHPRITYLTAEQKVGFSLADNKIALNSDWDMEQLQLLWRELSAADINFDLEVTRV